MSVMVDGGFNRGGDIAKALALGARGVLVGRAPLWGLASDGEAGATLALDILREELERVMAFTGVPNVSAYNPQLLHALAD
jgi:isopentenyl diphosphate isomerase/L-lactate dehydrogenase-like FMN-dependent dehydrogenase